MSPRTDTYNNILYYYTVVSQFPLYLSFSHIFIISNFEKKYLIRTFHSIQYFFLSDIGNEELLTKMLLFLPFRLVRGGRPTRPEKIEAATKIQEKI